MIYAFDAARNQLLAALPDAELQRWLPLLELVDLPVGRVLCESGRPVDDVFFPTTAIVSWLFGLENGDASEVAVIGSEGMVGASLFMSGDGPPSWAVVLCGGRGYRLCARAVQAAFDRNGPVTHLMLRYTQAIITQMTQTAACNRHHSLDKQLCRWLLSSIDRLPGNDLVTTQKLIAQMLGVRREAITEAALKLKAAGLINYTRGHISVINRPGLEQRSCECYAVVKKEYDRLLPDMLAV